MSIAFSQPLRGENGALRGGGLGEVLMGINPTAVLLHNIPVCFQTTACPLSNPCSSAPDLMALFLLPADFGVSIASFHSKLTPEMENSLYSQL